MKHPITSKLLTAGTLCTHWITALNACDHMGLNFPNPSQIVLIQFMVDKKVIPYFDFVYEHQNYNCLFQWDSVCTKTGHEALFRKDGTYNLLISLKCFEELNKLYLEDVEEFYNDQYLYYKSIGQEP